MAKLNEISAIKISRLIIIEY